MICNETKVLFRFIEFLNYFTLEDTTSGISFQSQDKAEIPLTWRHFAKSHELSLKTKTIDISPFFMLSERG